MLLSFLLALSGNSVGYLLGKTTKEELKPGKTLLHTLALVTLSILILTLLIASPHILAYSAGVLLGVLFRSVYFYFGLALLSTVYNKNLELTTTILIFLYGLTSGSLAYLTKNRNILLINALAFLLGLAFFFVSTNFISFAAGALTSITLRALYYALPHRLRPWQRKGPHATQH